MGKLGIYARTSIDKGNTSIEQQTEAGIKFAVANNLQYTVYPDEGISGYKIDEDDKEPYKNRPAFMALMSDIKSGEIDKVWVYEQSRLSRNNYDSAVIFRTFEKYHVTLYENNIGVDVDDPQSRLLRHIVSATSQFERSLIVRRTTRGLHDAINSGRRGFSEFYGYAKSGRGGNGMLQWTPVESEIAQIKFAYKEFLSGKSVRSIARSLTGMASASAMTEAETSVLVRKWTRVLWRFGNTGFSLNTDGLEILKKFERCETASIRKIANEAYYVKSLKYPVQIIPIAD